MASHRFWYLACVSFAVACGGGGSDGSAGAGGAGGTGAFDYVVDNPSPGDFGGPNVGGPAGGVGGTTSGDGSAGDGATDDRTPDAAEVLLEADIVQLVGDRLYALSEASGLTVVDASDPAALSVMGRYRMLAEPFEMYVEQDVAFVMLREYGRYVEDPEQGFGFRSSSHLLALDASDPADITVVGEADLPGDIQDSRRKGDVLYLVTHEGECWGCGDTPATIVTSFDISDLSQLEMIDQAAFEIESDYYGGEERSVHSTPERMYIAGPVWGGDEGHSLVHVLDISDDTGLLAEGTTFEVDGEIQSRWQMNEYEGVLRVVSQHPWDLDQAPVIETFTVTSATAIEPLGRATMTLPRPEQLRSVRFDGPRGYAITFERTDPLFTLDLSDPANPSQVGELEIPGWVYHMVPRGDRVVGLGFDEGNDAGSVNVSLFDVSDFANPVMLSRVHFGGSWADFTESQNRIHKAFSILDDEGLMLVPFVGWQDDDLECGMARSGVQLIDFSDDTLEARGMAEQRGAARRAMLHAGRLLAVSETAVQSYDIDDRDSPAELSSVVLARHVEHLARVGEHVVRIGADGDGADTTLDVVPAEDPDSLDPIGSLNLADAIGTLGEGDGHCEGVNVHPHAVFVKEDYLFFVQDVFSGDVVQALHVVDLADPTAPTLAATLEMRDFGIGDTTLIFATDAARQRLQPVGDWLVLHDADYDWDDALDRETSTAVFHIVDLSDPDDPQLWGALDRPDALGHGAIQQSGDIVYASRVVAADDAADQIAFFVDRLDLGGDTPKLLPSLNVPGPVVTYDPATERAVTVAPDVDFRDLSEEDCYERATAYGYDWDRDRCILVSQHLSLVELGDEEATVLSELEVEGDDTRLREAVGAEGLVFVTVGQGGYGYGFGGGTVDVGVGGAAGGLVSGAGGAAATPPGFYYEDYLPEVELLTVVGMDEGELRVAARTTVQTSSDLYDAILTSDALILPAGENGMGVMDASDPEDPSYTVHDLYGYCEELYVANDVAYCALDERGAQSIPLQ